MDKLRLYVTEAYDELMHKVSWPTWVELQQSAVVVLVAAVIMAFIVLGMDIASKFGEDFTYDNDNGNPAIGKIGARANPCVRQKYRCDVI